MSSIADQMNANALEAMKLTRKYFVVELDFSEASLRQLEALFDDVEFAMPGGRSPQSIDTLIRVWGSYLGEVIRRIHGGNWTTDKVGQSGYHGLQTRNTTTFPHDTVLRRLRCDPHISIWTYYANLHEIT